MPKHDPYTLYKIECVKLIYLICATVILNCMMCSNKSEEFIHTNLWQY